MQLTDSSYLSSDVKYTGKEYFPNKFGVENIWPIPLDLLKADGTIDLKFGFTKDLTSPYVGTVVPPAFSVKPDAAKPMDYYLFAAGTRFISGQPPLYAAVERSIVPPSKPGYFKVRIANFCESIQTSPAPLASALKAGAVQEDLTGPITLTYADGTPVSPATTNITTTQRTSDYIELPYGTYQFRMLTPNGRQIPGAGTSLVIHPPTSAVDVGKAPANTTTNLVYAPIRTYQPGGVYSLVVTPYNFNYLSDATSVSAGLYQNAYHVITDVNEEPNNSYCRLQGVNALSGNGAVSFRLNGKELASQIAFGLASPYGVYTTGDYKIEALNASGQVLAAVTQPLRAAQNYTAWLYGDTKGNAQILLVLNDFTGDFPFSKRFYNFSPDEPYFTFTLANGQIYNGSANNLTLGTAGSAISGSYLPDNPAYQIFPYRSTPNAVPGTWAMDIAVLNSSSFVANSALYTTPGRLVPNSEPGFYSVALIGRLGNAVPADKERIIVVKHNQ